MSKTSLISKYYALSKTKVRYISPNTRGIKEKIIASRRDYDFFDGNRKYGYGGYKYDGRWKNFAKKIIKKYRLTNNSKILHLNSEKGFLIYEILKILPKIKIDAYETSKYAIKNSISKEVKDKTKLVDSYLKIKLPKKKYDLSISIGVIYCLPIDQAIKMLSILKHISINSFINLASYHDKNDYFLWKNWSLLGCLLFKENEWKKILKYSGYDLDYELVNSKTLNLKKK